MATPQVTPTGSSVTQDTVIATWAARTASVLTSGGRLRSGVGGCSLEAVGHLVSTRCSLGRATQRVWLLGTLVALLVSGCSARPESRTHADLHAKLLWRNGPLPGAVQALAVRPGGEQLVVELLQHLEGIEDEDAEPGSTSSRRLWLVGDEEAPRPLTDGPWDTSPVWDQMGLRIAYLSSGKPAWPHEPGPRLTLEQHRDNLRAQANVICVLDVESGHVDRLPSDATVYSTVRWSPDGMAVASAVHWREAAEFAGEIAVAAVSSRSTSFISLGPDVLSTRDVAWSEGAERILVLAYGRANRELYLVDVGSGSSRRIRSSSAPFSLLEPRLDGRDGTPRFISYERDASNESVVLHGCALSGEALREVARLTAPEGKMAGAAVVSADGGGLAVDVAPSGEVAGGRSVLWTSLGGSGEISMPESVTWVGAAAWSHDSQQIAVPYRAAMGDMVAVYELVPTAAVTRP